jgi:hypothetical protein
VAQANPDCRENGVADGGGDHGRARLAESDRASVLSMNSMSSSVHSAVFSSSGERNGLKISCILSKARCSRNKSYMSCNAEVSGGTYVMEIRFD